MTHKSSCTFDLQNEVYQAWWTSHPDACKACDATGWVTSYDTVDYGSTTTQMQSDEVCQNCIEKGNCPMCGGIVIFVDDEPTGCMECDWTPDSGFRAPSAPECDCWDDPIGEYPELKGPVDDILNMPWTLGLYHLENIVLDESEEEEPEYHNRETCQCGDCEEYRHYFCGGGDEAPCCGDSKRGDSDEDYPFSGWELL